MTTLITLEDLILNGNINIEKINKLLELNKSEFTLEDLKTAGFAAAEVFSLGVNSSKLFLNGFDISRMEVNNSNQFFDLLANPNSSHIVVKNNIIMTNSNISANASNKIITGHDEGSFILTKI